MDSYLRQRFLAYLSIDLRHADLPITHPGYGGQMWEITRMLAWVASPAPISFVRGFWEQRRG